MTFIGDTSEPFLHSVELNENNSQEGIGPIFSNRFASGELIPSRFGPFTRLQVGTGRGVAILCVRAGEIVLARQPRYAVNKWLWEIPRGGVEIGESFMDAAIREIFEEIGLVTSAKHVTSLGIIFPDSGIMNTEVELFFVNIPDEISKDTIIPDRLEVDEVAWIPAPQVLEAVYNGSLEDQFTSVAILRAQYRKLF